MNTSLKIISLILAAALPGTIAVELSGLELPATMDPLHAFTALVAALVLLTVSNDYRRRASLVLPRRTVAFAGPIKAAHPLAA